MDRTERGKQLVSGGLAAVLLAVFGLLYYQATREGETVRMLRVEVAGVSIARLGACLARVG
jgi:hypothetical protein